MYVIFLYLKKEKKYLFLGLTCWKVVHIFAAFQPVALCDIEGVESIQVSREDEVTRRVLLNLKDPDKEVGIYPANFQSQQHRAKAYFMRTEASYSALLQLDQWHLIACKSFYPRLG